MIAWNNYWFKPQPYADLAIMRLVAVGLQLVLLMYGAAPLFGSVSAVGMLQSLQEVTAYPDAVWNPLLTMRVIGLLFFFEWGYRPSLEEMTIIYYVALGAGFLAFIGLFTNAAMAVFAIACVAMQSMVYSFGELHHPGAVMMLALGILALSPCGKLFSIDSKLRRNQMPSNVKSMADWEGAYAGWAIKLIQWFFVLMYLSAVVSKLGHGGLDWPNGFTLQYVMARDGLRLENPIGLWASQWHYLLMFSQYVVLLFQTTFMLAVLFPKLRWIYVPLGLFFHISNWLVISAPFPQWIALYVVFIPWSLAFRLIAEGGLKRAIVDGLR